MTVETQVGSDPPQFIVVVASPGDSPAAVADLLNEETDVAWARPEDL